VLVNRLNESALNNSPFHENQHIDWNTNTPRHWHAIWINSALMWPGNKLMELMLFWCDWTNWWGGGGKRERERERGWLWHSDNNTL